MILQKTYHKLQEWIIMLNSPDFKDTDADLVRQEMMEFAGEIWMNRNIEFNSPENKVVVSKNLNNSKNSSMSHSPDNLIKKKEQEEKQEDTQSIMTTSTNTKDYGHKDLIDKDYTISEDDLCKCGHRRINHYNMKGCIVCNNCKKFVNAENRCSIEKSKGTGGKDD